MGFHCLMSKQRAFLKCNACLDQVVYQVVKPSWLTPTICKAACETCGSSYLITTSRVRAKPGDKMTKPVRMVIKPLNITEKGFQIAKEREGVVAADV